MPGIRIVLDARAERSGQHHPGRRGRRPMTAWTHWSRGRSMLRILAVILPSLAGCQGLLGRHAEDKIPQYGEIDPHQPRELQMVSLPVYVVEPPDELEISVRPAFPDLSLTTLTVQSDGNIDLGFAGDVYVAGLTLAQVELKISQHLMANAGSNPPSERYQVSA